MEIEWNILCADSDRQSLELLHTIFKGQFFFYSADSIQKCKKILSKHPIHLLLIDQKIVRDSIETFSTYLSERYPQIVKILTGLVSNYDILIKAINSGFHHYIPKPWDNKELQKIIHQGLKTYAAKEATNHFIRDMQNIIDEMKFLHKISQKLSEKKPLPKLLNEIMESSKLLMNAEASSLLLYDEGINKLHFWVATGDKAKVMKKMSMDVGEGIAGWVAKHKKPLVIENCYKDSRFNPDYDKISRFRTKSMICVPLIRKNKLLGVIEVMNKKDGGAFKQEDLNIFETLASQCGIAIENYKLTEIQIEAEALKRELETARQIQQKLLPASLPQYHDIQVAAKLIPAKQVGGDYYNIIKINNNESLFFIADVTGKGIPAALIVSTIYTCITSFLKSNQDHFDLMLLVEFMNKVLIESTTVDKYVTCWFGLYKHGRNQLISMNAGHNPPFIFRKKLNKPIELDKGGIFLGSLEVPYQTETINLLKEDVIVFFTDGVTEAWNIKEDEYNTNRLILTVSKHLRESANRILSEIEKDVKKHVGKAQQSDDFTCAVVKIL